MIKETFWVQDSVNWVMLWLCSGAWKDPSQLTSFKQYFLLPTSLGKFILFIEWLSCIYTYIMCGYVCILCYCCLLNTSHICSYLCFVHIYVSQSTHIYLFLRYIWIPPPDTHKHKVDCYSVVCHWKAVKPKLYLSFFICQKL